MPSLSELYQSKTGKVSDKWDSYLTLYDQLLASYRDRAGLRLLEIGIQNGGSLEIWAQFFPLAGKIIGSDINPICGELVFDDPRVSVVIGDSTMSEVRESIVALAGGGYDVVIEDASHNTDHIIRSFVSLFPLVSEGGIYISEDLHCSYWWQFGGGLYDEFSAISFFKKLVDGVNCKAWTGNGDSIRSLFAPFVQRYGLDADSLERCIDSLASLEFHDSVCVLRKRCSGVPARLARKVVAGDEATVEPEIFSLRSLAFQPPDQTGHRRKSDAETLRLELDRIQASRTWRLLRWLRRFLPS